MALGSKNFRPRCWKPRMARCEVSVSIDERMPKGLWHFPMDREWTSLTMPERS